MCLELLKKANKGHLYLAFPKMKLKLKGLCFEAVSDIQAVLNSIKENYFYGAFEVWKK
jgi:hypothetical protein